jgi:K+-transporting ATPase KdpF subunit
LSDLSAENWVGLIAAVILTVYLVYALVRPEKF